MPTVWVLHTATLTSEWQGDWGTVGDGGHWSLLGVGSAPVGVGAYGNCQWCMALLSCGKHSTEMSVDVGWFGDRHEW